jgi:ribokinase
VCPDGENQITVCSGANAAVTVPQAIEADALICQLEIPVAVVAETIAAFSGFTVVNLAPAAPVPDALIETADLLIVNETEAAFYGEGLHRTQGLVALTLGARGAELWQGGRRIAQASPPAVTVVDTTGAGDVFVAALTVGLVGGMTPQAALDFRLRRRSHGDDPPRCPAVGSDAG